MGINSKKQNYWKGIISYMIALMVLVAPFSLIGNQAKAAENQPNVNLSEVEKMEKDLEIFFEKVVYTDENGVEQIDFDEMEKHFGKEETEQAKAVTINSEQAEQCDQTTSIKVRAAGTFTSCMKDALLDYLGVTAVEAMITGGVWKYLEKKAWKEAAKLAVKIGIGTNAATLAATFIFYGGKCAYQYGF